MAAPEQQPIHTMMQDVVSALNDFPVTLDPVERFAFYERAKQGFALIATGETRLYGNFIFKKGVVAPDSPNVCQTSQRRRGASVHPRIPFRVGL
jgi:L-fucose mutarotase